MASTATSTARTLLLALLLSGCATTPRVTSKGPGLPAPAPKRLLVWSLLDSTKMGATWGPEFSRGFCDQLVADLRHCGVEATVFSETGLELEEDALKKAVEKAEADGALLVKKEKGSLNQYGGVISISYAFSLIVPVDPKQSLAEASRKNAKVKTAWEGSGRFMKGGTYWATPLAYQAARFADEVVNRAIADGRLPGCAPVVMPKPPEEPQP